MNAAEEACRDALAILAAQLRGDIEGVALLVADVRDAGAVIKVLSVCASAALQQASGHTVTETALADLVADQLRRIAVDGA